MKTIKITRGVFGYVEAPGKPVTAKTPRDPAFSVDDAIADRLVEKKVAVYTDTAPVDPAPADPNPAGSEGTEPPAGEYSEDMTRDKLNEIAKSYGVEAPEKIKGGKAAVIAAIEAAKVKAETEEGDEGGEGEGSGETPPAPGVADPV